PVEASGARMTDVWCIGDAPRSFADSICDDVTVIEPADEETLAARKAAWTAPVRELTGYAKRYAQHVTSGSTGAVFDDML
ncbi:MAG: hypothetical protein IJC52_00295, partial [Clostridia bacterium]|nr:hypothetical protein [Clostridia bacterium]